MPNFVLKDANSGKSVNVRAEHTGKFLEIMVEGYGEPGASYGNGSVAYFEFHDNKLKLIYHTDVNNEESQVIVDLEGLNLKHYKE